jgi:misacylated tRNA(Ala) deacylase
MTELLYQTDAYVKEFTARVTAAEGNAVALDRTALYATGGGQPHDTGTLSEILTDGRTGGRTWQVTEVRKQGDDVWHTLQGDGLPDVGAQVSGVVDWERRYKLMRTHTALHLLCGVVFRDYGALVTGGNMDTQEGRLDFELRDFTPDLAQQIVDAVNAEIAAARPVEVKILPRDQAFKIPDLIRTKINLLPEGIANVRTVNIIGLDLQADGGTHVANTREVGRVTLLKTRSKGANNKRIVIGIEE